MHSGRVRSGNGFPAEVQLLRDNTQGKYVSYILPHLLLEKIFSFRSIFYSLNNKRSLTSLELGLSGGKISFTRSGDTKKKYKVRRKAIYEFP